MGAGPYKHKYCADKNARRFCNQICCQTQSKQIASMGYLEFQHDRMIDKHIPSLTREVLEFGFQVKISLEC
jgi:hypothetical protein